MSVFPDDTPIPPLCPHGNVWAAFCSQCWHATAVIPEDDPLPECTCPAATVYYPAEWDDTCPRHREFDR